MSASGPQKRFARRSTKRLILSTDGGGLRALIPATVCLELEHIIREVIIRKGIPDVDGNTYGPDDRFSVRLSDFFDVMAGTSGGGLVALFLAYEGTPEARQATQDWLDKDEDLQRVGREFTHLANRPVGSAAALQSVLIGKGSTIFSARDKLRFLTSGFPGGAGGLFAPKYTNAGLSEVAKHAWGEHSLLGNSLSTSVLIPAWEMRGNRPYFFYHRESKKDPDRAETGFAALPRTLTEGEIPDQGAHPLTPTKKGHESLDTVLFCPGYNFPVWQVARATSSAQSYFPAGHVDIHYGKERIPRDFVDGGTFLNNPTNFSWAYAASTYKVPPDECAILSLGCGSLVQQPTVKPGAGGVGWLREGGLISCLMEGPSDCDAALGSFIFHQAYPNSGKDQLLRLQYVAFDLEGHEKGAQVGNDKLDSGLKPSTVLGPMDNPNYYREYMEIADRLLKTGPHDNTYRDRMLAWVNEYMFPDNPNPAQSGVRRSNSASRARIPVVYKT